MKPQPSDRLRDCETGRPGALDVPSSQSRVVLGIDPGLATTGWGVVEKTSSALKLLAFGTIVTPAKHVLPERLLHIQKELSRLIGAYQPSVMAIEELFFTKFAVSIAATAQARGVILLTAAQHALSLIEYNPRTVKIAMTGFGSASKFQMQSMVQRQFRLKDLPRPDDAADALAIALCHIQTNPALKSSELVSRQARDFSKTPAHLPTADLLTDL